MLQMMWAGPICGFFVFLIYIILFSLRKMLKLRIVTEENQYIQYKNRTWSAKLKLITKLKLILNCCYNNSDVLKVSKPFNQFSHQTFSSTCHESCCFAGSTAVVRAVVRVRQAFTPVMKAGKQMMSRVTGLLSQTQCMVCLVPPTPPAKETPQTVSPGGMMSSACLFQPRYSAGTADMDVFVTVVGEDEVVSSVQSLGGILPSCAKNLLQKCCIITCSKAPSLWLIFCCVTLWFYCTYSGPMAKQIK